MSTTINDPTERTKTEHCIDLCNSLLRGEISAVETYGQAIDRFSDEPEVATLIRIQSEHQKAIELLRENVLSMRGLPETESGAWGATTKAIQAVADFFGETSAIRSLQQGEELGQAAYESALENEDAMPECKILIRNQLLPMVNEHIVRLEKLNESAASHS